MYAQNVLDAPITFSKGEGTLEFFLKEIAEKTGYTFAYINNQIPLQKKIVLKNENQTVKDVLDALFVDLDITFEVKATKIILTSKKKGNANFIISGIVKDKLTGELLPGANIFIKELSSGATSNNYGFYSLTLPAGDYQLICSYIGYQSQVNQVILTNDVKLDLELSGDSAVLNEVTVSAIKEDESIYSTEMSVVKPDLRLIKQMPAFLGEVDVIKSIIQLPGITTVGEASPGFNVRGGGIDQNLLLLDEAPVYNSSHLFGFYSVFNPDAVKDIKLYKGGIPANYGGRLSSVLEITQKDGNGNEFHGSGGIGVVASRLLLEGPLVKNKSSFLITARRSYADIFLKRLKYAELDEAYFYDINAKLNYSFNPNNKVYLSGYFGRDRYRVGDNVDISWGNTTCTLRWNHLFTNKLFSNVTAVYSNYNYSQGEPKGVYAYKGYRSIKSYNLKADFTWYHTLRHKVDFGVSSLLYQFEPGKVSPVDISEINYINIPDEHAIESAAYVSDEYKLTEGISFNLGIRYSLFQNIGPTETFIYDEGYPKSVETIIDTVTYSRGKIIKSYGGFEPRASFNFKLSDRSAVKASYNRTRQYLHFISNTTTATAIDFWKASNQYLKPETADQIAIGYFRNFKENMFQTSVEVYYKKIINLVDYKNGADLILNPALDGELLQGSGRAYGAEFLINKTKGRLRGWLGYTYSKTERLINGPTVQEKINGGKYYPANYDQPNKVNLVLNYEFNSRWTFSTNFTYNTGRPITYPDGGFWLGGRLLPNYASRNQDRIPDYHRLDISATLNARHRPGKRWAGSWTFSIYNLYARQNAYSIYFRSKVKYGIANSRETEAVQFSILGTIFPSITYNVKF